MDLQDKQDKQDGRDAGGGVTLAEALKGWRWEGADGAALEAAWEHGERAGRGILFMGAVGSGKTTAARALVGSRGGVLIECAVPERVAALGWWRDWGLPERCILLDELGRDAVRMEYGERRDVVAQFVRELYASWKEGEWRGRLYATTNLDAGGLVKAYDESVADRLFEMAVVCRFREARRVLAEEAGGEEGRHGDRPGQTGTEGEGSAVWSEYAEAGIDLRSEVARAAGWWPGANGGALMDAIRVLKVNLGAFDGTDCEKFRAVRMHGNTGRMGTFVKEAFLYGGCAEAGMARRWAAGVRAYVGKVFEGSELAQKYYRPDNALVFKGWQRAFDFGEMVAIWRRNSAEARALAAGGAA